jgi:excisionase family DNA binding protein
MDADRDILTVTELADYLRCNKSTIYKLVKTGELPGFKIGSDWRFRADQVEQWLRRSQSSQQASARTGH